ncbi:MAG: metallophosphatase family protein [Acidobacteria bacterium]|nr:MAG: metallophosphatase family protein [Acidobacteriota bacterium]
MKVSVLGDVHGNLPALQRALASIRQRGTDRVVILGDLLTYGPFVRDVVDLVADVVGGGRATLLRGNHDWVYSATEQESETYRANLADWVRESIEWCRVRLDYTAFCALPWVDESVVEGILLSHANPYGLNDWTYLSAGPEEERAAAALAGRDVRFGVFGHTHRSRVFSPHLDGGRALLPGDRVEFRRPCADGCAVVMNAGSVGQPRYSPPASVFLELVVEPSSLLAELVPVTYDVGQFCRSIAACSMSEGTKERLKAFFTRD